MIDKRYRLNQILRGIINHRIKSTLLKRRNVNESVQNVDGYATGPSAGGK